MLLDDGVNDLQAKTVSLGTRKQTFSGVATGVKVTAQMAIVVDTAEGGYLISDILEATIPRSLTAPAFSTVSFDTEQPLQAKPVNQSLTAPSFSTGWIIKGRHPRFVPGVSGFDPRQVDVPLPDLGMLYYIGYNANFGNYQAGEDLGEDLTVVTRPATPRFRIGLAHGDAAGDVQEDVKFDAYVIRLIGGDGDIVPGGDDVRTMASDYGQGKPGEGSGGVDEGHDYALVLALSVVDVYGGPNDSFVPLGATTDSVFVTPEQAAQHQAALVAAGPLVNVRVNDDGAITSPMYQSEIVQAVVAADPANAFYSPADKIAALEIAVPDRNDVHALPPDAHREFPIDVLASDQSYTIEAWAVNEDRAVISPKATLKVHLRVQAPTMLGSGAARFEDYLNGPDGITSGTLLTTEFTVLK